MIRLTVDENRVMEDQSSCQCGPCLAASLHHSPASLPCSPASLPCSPASLSFSPASLSCSPATLCCSPEGQEVGFLLGTALLCAALHAKDTDTKISVFPECCEVRLDSPLGMVGKRILLFGLLMEMFKGRMEEHGRHKLCIQILARPLGGHGP